MDTGRWLRALKVTLPFLCVLTLPLFAPPTADGETAGGMQAYCSLPPLPGLGVKPNLLLMIDNSSSMYDLAYTDRSSYCIDDTFDPNASYLGYFDRGSLYLYSFAKDDNGKEAGTFVLASGAGIASSSCNQARTGDVCVNASSGVVNSVLATGNFLNWLGMSKLDIEKMALTGGKYDPASGMLEAETRGCQGKRFVKMVGDQEVTFAVRGPLADESDYVKQSSYGGGTRIDIYTSRYNKEECTAAIAAWQNRSSEPLSDRLEVLTATLGGCMGEEWEELSPTVPTKGKVFNEIMSICYAYLGDEKNIPLTETDSLRLYCGRRYLTFYSGNPVKIVQNTGDDVCGKNLFHNTNIPGSNSVGYVGGCYLGGGRFNNPCVMMETRDYCANVQNPWLIDPSGADANIPGFVLDAGTTNMGAIAGTLRLRFAPPAEPRGLVQLFGSDINFGAMTFNENGARTECGGAIPCIKHCQKDDPPRRECTADSDCGNSTCSDADTKTDGGRVISHLNSSPLGDHTPGSGLVAAIDAIRGTSWTPLSETLYQAIGYFSNRASFELQPADFDETLPPSRYSCQTNHVLIVTDGMSTADRAPEVTGFVATAVRDWVSGGDMPVSQTTAPGVAATDLPPYQGSYNLDDLAWIARNRNIFDPDRPIALQRDYISTHVVYTGAPCGDPGSTSTPKAGYNADGSCATGDEGVPEKMMQLTAAKGSGSFNGVQDPAGLQEALKKVFMLIRGGSNAGTGASIISTGQGNGALFLQAQYYPNRSFDGGTTSAAWIGEMQSLWYYIDPFIASTGGASTIREDTGGGRTLDLKQDRVVQFSLDPVSGESVAKLYADANGDGSADFPQPSGYPATVAPEAVQSLWRAGLLLWRREAGDRTIYTQTGGTLLVPFLDSTKESNRLLLRAKDRAEADQIISFVKGGDAVDGVPPTRNRSISADQTGEKKVWKLGDIISSAPVQQSSVPLGSYHLPTPTGYADGSYAAFINPAGDYGKRGTVYVGANDGMLHAFRLGNLKVRPGQSESWPAGQKAALSGDGLGEEQWAFIPKGALPYLRYLKEPLYPHLYYVDGSSTLIDASLGDPANCSRAGYWDCAKTGSSWRTVLVGGMGLGGASRGAGVDCVKNEETTCVNAPPGEGGGGLSSYFALDVTEQGVETGTPRLLWEFSHPELGFATSGAAVLKIKARSAAGDGGVIHDPDKNGRWFAVFASGPTGPIDRDARRFLAWSDQELKLFVVDLNAVPPLTQGVNYWVIGTGIKDAFGGNITSGGIDTDKRDADEAKEGQYEDDALYVGYTRRADDGVSWTGGVLRLFTREDPDPSTWRASRVIDDIGPVTGGVVKLQDRNHKRLWLYFGTGRFFHNQDDLTAGRAIFGVSEPCYTQDNSILRDERQSCSTESLSRDDLTDVTDESVSIPDTAQGDTSYRGWWIALDPAAGSLASERMTVTPSALTGGAVLFTTYKPPVDVCLEGVSYLWGVKYNTGGAVSSLNGKALLQLSNGSGSDLMLTGFTDKGKRRSHAMVGKAEKPRLITNSGLRPLKKIIHIQER